MSENDKEKAHSILASPIALVFMSSEESDMEAPYPGRGPRQRKSHRLPWERTRVRNIKAKLDNTYHNVMTQAQKRTRAIVHRDDEDSARPLQLIAHSGQFDSKLYITTSCLPTSVLTS